MWCDSLWSFDLNFVGYGCKPCDCLVLSMWKWILPPYNVTKLKYNEIQMNSTSLRKLCFCLFPFSFICLIFVWTLDVMKAWLKLGHEETVRCIKLNEFQNKNTLITFAFSISSNNVYDHDDANETLSITFVTFCNLNKKTIKLVKWCTWMMNDSKKPEPSVDFSLLLIFLEFYFLDDEKMQNVWNEWID